MDKEMQKALELDGKKLEQLTGEDHGPHWIDQNYQIDRYGVALMMIREGCDDPSGLARRILAEFGNVS